MLELKKITKLYQTGEFKQMALKGIDLKFVPGDIVSILGPSGCGKTTLLNIIGGLDRYTDGDLIINGVSTRKFKDNDWDSYRNNSIGFVFQSYNLINHITVLDNVEMALTLSGVTPKERKERASEVLNEVGLGDHLHKRPNQLSGGQKQRVAIARAIVNNPDIILMDEPTGALDSKSSVQILELVKEIAKGKLVIMVTHNPTLAEEYSTRIIKLHDGEIIDDTKPVTKDKGEDVYKPKKTSMSFKTALKLSFNNLRTKKGRSLITSFAASIGIIGIALVLSIANGFNSEISRLEKESLSGMPVTIDKNPMVFDFESLMNVKEPVLPDGDYIIPYDYTDMGIGSHKNLIDLEYINYLKSLGEEGLFESIIYQYSSSMFNLLKKTDIVSPINASRLNFSPLPGNDEYILDGFKPLAGNLPTTANQIVLVTDQYHRVNRSILEALGIEITDKINYEDLIGLKIVSAKNNDYYQSEVIPEFDNKVVFKPNTNLTNAFDNGFELEIVGILTPIKDTSTLLISEGIAYNNEFAGVFLEDSINSEIVLAQKTSEYDVKTGMSFSPNPLFGTTKDSSLASMGGAEIPESIKIYTKDFDTKSILKERLNQYNEDKTQENKIVYSDLTEQFASSMSTIVDSISIVLIAFAAISLVVSSIMIAIITYVSVLERTKEIGVLRSLGARKKDISRVFNAETILIGFVAGLLGVGIAYLLTIPINIIFTNALNGMMSNIANLAIPAAIVLILISVVLTLVSGLVPAKIAAKKDPVDALRMEN